MKLSCIAEGDRAAYRAENIGVSSLSYPELVTCLIRGRDQAEVAARIVERFPTAGTLAKAESSQLTDIKGVGRAVADTIQASFQIGARRSKIENGKTRIFSVGNVVSIIGQDMADLQREEFWVLCLDSRNGLEYIDHLYRGTVDSSIVSIGEMFTEAIRRHCTQIIVAHNHPSGDPSPSANDIALTRRISEAGELLGIDVLDHVVIGGGEHISIASSHGMR